MNSLNGKRAKSSFALTILILCLLTSSFIIPAFADITLFDDQGTSFWSIYNNGSGSIVGTITTDTSFVHSGSSSLKQVITAGTYQTVGFYHVFNPNADWSTATGVSFWLYGSSSGTYISFDIIDQNHNYYAKLIQDNFNGWKQFTLNFATASSSGTVDLKNINIIEFAFTSPAPPILYLDQMVLIGASAPTPSPSPSANPSPSPTVSPTARPSPSTKPTAAPSPSTHPTASPSPSTSPTASPKTTSTPTPTTSSTPSSTSTSSSTPSQTASPQPTSSPHSPTPEPVGSLFSPFYPTFTSAPTTAPTSTPTATPISTNTTSPMSLLEGAVLLIMAIIIILVLTLTRRKRKTDT